MAKKRIVITGSEGLIGKKLVDHFSDKFEVLKLDLALGHDLTSEDFVSGWFRANRNLYGMIVCHALNPVPVGKTIKQEPVDTPLEELRQYMEVNALSAFSVCQNFIRNNMNGTIINIASLYGVVSPRHDIYNNFVKPLGYSMSKAAVIIMTKYLATYYAPLFRINTVVLGGISDKKQEDTFVLKYSRHAPVGRMMDIEEVPPIFELLLDPRSTYMTGAEFYVDGGWTAW
ncbi:MAG: SDR family oxidoreductase [bacterium]|nr:SDR family oxidoreductase [bacterium]